MEVAAIGEAAVAIFSLMKHNKLCHVILCSCAIVWDCFWEVIIFWE